MDKLIKREEWYQALIEDIVVINEEGKLIANQALIKSKWLIGDRILSEHDNWEREKIYGKKIVNRVSQSLKMHPRGIWLCIQFRKKYLIFDKIPKELSWREIRKLLPPHKEEENILAPIEGIHEVIVVDPPWPYGTEYNKDTRRVASPYKELSM